MSDVFDRQSLLWALDRLCLWGELDGEESADPHVRGEAAASATVTLEQLAWELRTESEQSEGERNVR